VAGRTAGRPHDISESAGKGLVNRTQLSGPGLVNYDLINCTQCGVVEHVIDLRVREALDEVLTILRDPPWGR
jgi:hypothetical protein